MIATILSILGILAFLGLILENLEFVYNKFRSLLPPELDKLGYFKYDRDGKLLTKVTGQHQKYQEVTRVIALDCEKVEVVVDGKYKEAVGRVSIVNEFGYCLFDSFVRPEERITHLRTYWSGIRSNDMINAKPFKYARESILDLIEGRIIVGHSLKGDLRVLHVDYPNSLRRDLGLPEYWQELQLLSSQKSLKALAKDQLGVDIQTGEHNSIEDAQASMALYQLVKFRWEHMYNQ